MSKLRYTSGVRDSYGICRLPAGSWQRLWWNATYMLQGGMGERAMIMRGELVKVIPEIERQAAFLLGDEEAFYAEN